MTRMLSIAIQTWESAHPVRIAGHVVSDMTVVVVTLSQDGFEGRGEAAGAFYKSETAAGMAAEIEVVRGALEVGMGRNELRALLPAGGARNAVDCALWDLEAGLQGRPVWDIALGTPLRPLLTACTIGAEAPAAMAAVASRRYGAARALKLKLLGDEDDGARVRAVRAAREDVWLGVDLNQGGTRDHLARLAPVLRDARVSVVEQPFPIGDEAWMDGLDLGIPTVADESAQGLDDVERLVGRFDIVNIKLDKCGGLTEALMIADRAHALGLGTMVGNMGGTGLAMAPALVVGQSCGIVDLDGPLFLKRDRQPELLYRDGLVSAPPGLWGDGERRSDASDEDRARHD